MGIKSENQFTSTNDNFMIPSKYNLQIIHVFNSLLMYYKNLSKEAICVKTARYIVVLH